MQRLKSNQKAHSVWPLFLFSSALVVLLIWLPFGFQLIGLIEEWDVLGLFTQHSLFFVASPDSPLGAHALRPLTVFPHAIANWIDPDSFNFWHIILILSLLMKGIAGSFLVWSLTYSRGWSVLFGLLLIVYPADTMQLSFRGLHINLSLGLLLVATSIQFSIYDDPSGWKRHLLTGISVFLLFISICMYESALAFVPALFLLRFVQVGIRNVWQDFLKRPGFLLSWMIAPALYILYAIFISLFWFKHGGSYQQSIMGGGLISLIKQIPKLFTVGLPHALAGGWFSAFGMVLSEFKNYAYLVLVALVCMGLVFFSFTPSSDNALDGQAGRPSGRFLTRMVIAGILMVILGYLPYLFSGAHVLISQRTYLLAAPGAALVTLALLMTIFKLSRRISLCLGAVLLFFGIGAQLYQFHHYLQIANTQRQLLRNIIENFDGNIGDKTLLILDGSNRLNHTWMLNNLDYALTYLYGKPVHTIEVCFPGGVWQKRDSLARNGECIEEEGRWRFKAAAPLLEKGLAQKVSPDFSIPKDKLIVITIQPDGSIKHDRLLDSYRSNLKTSEDHVAMRYRKILADPSWPLSLSLFKPDEGAEHYRWDFGKWWSLELPIHGIGWREAVWDIKGFSHRAWAWKNQGHSSLLFNLAPIDKPYVLRGRFQVIVNESIRQSIRIRLNQRDLKYRLLDKGMFEAEIPRNILMQGINTIEFNSLTDPNYFGLSAGLEWFEVYPLKTAR